MVGERKRRVRQEDGGERSGELGLPYPEAATGHRWQTIGQLVTFQQAAKTREGEAEKEGVVEEKWRRAKRDKESRGEGRVFD